MRIAIGTEELVRAFLLAEFTGKERCRERLEKVKALEARYPGRAKN